MKTKDELPACPVATTVQPVSYTHLDVYKRQARILDKSLVLAQIHRHGAAAVRADWHQFTGDAPVPLRFHHPIYCSLILKGLLAARLTALKQPIVALCVK